MRILMWSIGLVLAIAALFYWRRSRGPRLNEIAPANVLKEKYGLTAENRPTIFLDPREVPEHLRDLIPMAEKWGIGDDIIRSDVEDKASQAEKEELSRRVQDHTVQIDAWLNSFHGSDMTDAAAAFMYMTLAMDEMGLWPKSE